jgi:hypothetical protein
MSTAELAAVDVVMAMSPSVAVPTGGERPDYFGSGSGLRPRLARKPKSQPSLAWVMCSVYRAP